jgi:ABC-2 type transport system ATP-binding protein
MGEQMIKVQDFGKRFRKTQVIEGLDCTFHQGERIALIGQNGAGKTTLIRSILGLYKYQGKIDVLGFDPRKQRSEMLKNIGFVPQIPPPVRMTVAEMVSFFSKITKTEPANFSEISTNLGLDIRANWHKPFKNLSGGMKQKLMVSFALGRDPDILLMDEPAANLDPKARKILFDYLFGFNPNALMIISSHRTDELQNLVNRVIEMDLGKIVKDEKL